MGPRGGGALSALLCRNLRRVNHCEIRQHLSRASFGHASLDGNRGKLGSFSGDKIGGNLIADHQGCRLRFANDSQPHFDHLPPRFAVCHRRSARGTSLDGAPARMRPAWFST